MELRRILTRLAGAIALTCAWSSGAAADPVQPPAAACLESAAPGDDHMRTWIATWADGASRRSLTVRGVAFADQPASLLREYIRLVPASAPPLASGCTTVECALDERFGQGVGLRLLYMLLRHGFNGSQLDRPHAQPWTREELDDVLLALSDLPPHAAPERPLPLLLTSDRSDADVVAVDPTWTGLARADRRFALFVAIARHFEQRLMRRPQFGAMWQAALGGDAKPQPGLLRLAGMPVAMPELDAGSDMSVGAALYRYAPQSLSAAMPNLYALLRETYFDGLEYRSDAQCVASRSLSGMAERVARAKLDRAVMTEANQAIVAEDCLAADGACARRALYRAYLLKARLQLATFAPAVALAAFEAGLTETGLDRRLADAPLRLAALSGNGVRPLP